MALTGSALVLGRGPRIEGQAVQFGLGEVLQHHLPGVEDPPPALPYRQRSLGLAFPEQAHRPICRSAPLIVAAVSSGSETDSVMNRKVSRPSR